MATDRGAYTHYLQATCKAMPRTNRVRTYPHHPIRTYFNNPDRKAYVIENRTDHDFIVSIGLKPWVNEEGQKYLTVKSFEEHTVRVNTSQEYQHFLKLHDPVTKKILDCKYLNTVYSLISIFGSTGCTPKLQLQITPGW